MASWRCNWRPPKLANRTDAPVQDKNGVMSCVHHYCRSVLTFVGVRMSCVILYKQWRYVHVLKPFIVRVKLNGFLECKRSGSFIVNTCLLVMNCIDSMLTVSLSFKVYYIQLLLSVFKMNGLLKFKFVVLCVFLVYVVFSSSCGLHLK